MKKLFSQLPTWLVLLVVMALFTLVFFNIYILAILPLVVGIFVYFITKTQRTFIKKYYTSIDNLSEGIVKIEGKIEAEKTLESPYFKEECISYTYKDANIDYDDETGSEYTKNAILKSEFQDFYISDATGKIKVNSKGLDISFLSIKTKLIGKKRHTERTLKYGDEITIIGTAVKNNENKIELQKSDKNPFTVSDHTNINNQKQVFRTINFFLPYIIFMYILVNYFLFAPLKINIKENEIFPYFAIFGMPILAVILGIIGNQFEGFIKQFLSNFAGICFFVALLTIPLICLFYIIELEFSRIICIWLNILVCTTLAFVFDYKKLDGVFDEK